MSEIVMEMNVISIQQKLNKPHTQKSGITPPLCFFYVVSVRVQESQTSAFDT